MMRTYRGIVCEKNKTDMIFLTNEGEFLRGIPLRNAEVGEEVPFRLATKPVLRQKKIIGPALIAAVLLFVFVASLIPQSSSAYAYVQVEGKQNIEFGVDKVGTVLSVKSLDDSTSIDEKWKGLSIDVALTKVVGNIEEKEKLVITTKYEQKEKSERIEKAVKQVREKQVKQKNKDTKQIIEKPVQINPVVPPPVKEQKVNEKRQEKQVNPTPNEKPEKTQNSSKPKEESNKNNSQNQPKQNKSNDNPKPNENKGQEQKNKNAGNKGIPSSTQNNKSNNGKNPKMNNDNNHKNNNK